MVRGNGVLYRSPLFRYRYILMFSFLTGMASITISPVSSTPAPQGMTTVTGDEKLIVINKGGKTSTISVNQILDLVDDDIVDRIDDQLADQVTEQVTEQVSDKIDEIIDERLENVDPNNNLNWNEVV